MKNTAVPAEVPQDTEISRHLAGAQFYDCWKLAVEPNTQSALELYLAVVSKTPSWVNRLMTWRNNIVGLFGLKNLGHLGAVPADKPASAYRIGERIGIFSLLYLSENEIVLGDSDKHLNVRVSVCKIQQKDACAISVSTVVHVHNTLGHLYMFFVAPVHKLIVPAMLNKIEWGQQ